MLMNAPISLAAVNLNLLVALDALLHEASVTRAAARVGVTQGAMSQSLAQLRGIFDDRLLVRGGRGMTRTPRARSLAPRVRRALGEVSRVFEGPDTFDPATAERELTIAGQDVGAFLVAPELTKRLAALAPRVRLRWVPVGDRRSLDERLETRELDLAVDVSFGAKAGIEEMQLEHSDFLSVVRADHPRLKRRRRIGWKDFSAIPHVVVSAGGPGMKSPVDRALEAVGRSRRVGLRVPFFMAAPFVLLDTDYLWNTSRTIAERCAKRLPLRILEPPLRIPGPRVVLKWHARYHDDPSHRWLRSQLAAVVGSEPTRSE